ncbi:hypothetical protein [Parageobacillus thermoglucosidasius]|uniref:Uncharacterized protein n=2 Tax=Parageobacillus thermoglucosidasius TaxID=1426 RepID=A0AAN0YL39_PARTM|nr:hypothetical protein [Parageobacillus thermoglucosidasius]AEH46317.1 hypothetical protein Geoth_0269 [Parageobacillus thermoglucosidasius C56-YS93]ALF08846.1 hypothetical protein AOT13_01630 [Parageobacillus thermoglucosidasius]ANZ28928.1 hypothetical protein BCV53_01635 [Parageobacillus thermoglucosidasius]APM79667.1 hypothetical protein BCV54_01645 [Parageobacillus thermoglucosidasius]KJX69435.1 hypothetical protein WH82_06670 [Parageobacillus thermoglucosidasius]
MNMTKEEVARALSVLFHELTAHWTKEKIHSDVLETIMKLRIESAGVEEYMHGLIANVAFATESSYALQQVLGTMLQEQSFLSPAAVEKMMNEAQARIRGHIAELISRYKTHFEQIHDKTERKKQLERSYSALLIVNRIKTDFLFQFIHESNQNAAKRFFAANPNDVLEAFHHLSSVYASRWLEGLELHY